MAYTNFFISLIILIATGTICILTKDYLISKAALTTIFGFFIFLYILIVIVLYIKNLRVKKILDFKIPNIATDYYKNKYKKDLKNYHLELEHSVDFLFVKEYSGAAYYIYIDKERTKYIYIYLNSKFELANINDNIEDDIIIKDIETVLSNTKEKYNALYSVTLYKRASIIPQFSYKNNINDYLINNPNVKFTVTIIKKIEDNDEDFDYNSFSENIYSSLLKDFNNIEIDMGILFTRSEERYNDFLECIEKFDYADILFMMAFDNAEYDELENDKYSCVIIRD